MYSVITEFVVRLFVCAAFAVSYNVFVFLFQLDCSAHVTNTLIHQQTKIIKKNTHTVDRTQ